MTTIAATFDPERLAVDLIIDAEQPGAILLELRRTDVNGEADVRLPGMPDTFETFTVADYEVALVQLASYEVTVDIGGTVERAEVSVETSAPPFSWVLHPAVVPEDVLHVTFVDWAMQRASRSSKTTVIDRPDPIVNRGPLGMREGTLEVWLPSYDAVLGLEMLAASGDTIMVRQNDFPGLDGYFEVDRIAPRIQRDTARPGDVKWWATLTLTEVGRPSGPLLAATSWTWGAVLADYPTWRDVRDAFPTWRDLLLNTPEEAA